MLLVDYHESLWCLGAIAGHDVYGACEALSEYYSLFGQELLSVQERRAIAICFRG